MNRPDWDFQFYETASERNKRLRIKRLDRNATAGRTASWVVREISTKRVIMETFNGNLRETINAEKYEMVPIEDYFASLNNSSP